MKKALSKYLYCSDRSDSTLHTGPLVYIELSIINPVEWFPSIFLSVYQNIYTNQMMMKQFINLKEASLHQTTHFQSHPQLEILPFL